jgi:hypothetical protein
MQRCQTNGYGMKTTEVNINIAGGCSGAPEVRYHRFWTPIYIYTYIYIIYQWNGLRDKLQDKPILMGKSMVSCRFSLKPNHGLFIIYPSNKAQYFTIFQSNFKYSMVYIYIPWNI